VHNDALDLDKVGAYFDVLTLPDQSPDSVRKDLERLIAAIRKENPEFDAEVETEGWEPPMSGNFCWGAPATPEDSDIVQTVARHHRQVRAEEPVIGSGRRFGATSDAASFRRVGIPTIEYAPGSIGPGGELKAWPAIDERVRIKDVFDCTRILARATAQLVNQPRDAERSLYWRCRKREANLWRCADSGE
jgi:acetylornithine deacetylase/succinyl-diaminopimelate desuccinylase-like protein